LGWPKWIAGIKGPETGQGKKANDQDRDAGIDMLLPGLPKRPYSIESG